MNGVFFFLSYFTCCGLVQLNLECIERCVRSNSLFHWFASHCRRLLPDTFLRPYMGRNARLLSCYLHLFLALLPFASAVKLSNFERAGSTCAIVVLGDRSK